MISTSISQVEKPSKITTDSRGTEIITGVRVAYNFQGRVILGTIVNYKRCDWYRARPGIGRESWWALRFELHIENEAGDISKIKNPNSFIII